MRQTPNYSPGYKRDLSEILAAVWHFFVELPIFHSIFYGLKAFKHWIDILP